MKRSAIKVIKIYQFLSRSLNWHGAMPLLFAPACRFYPTCSDYSIEVINKYGFWAGSIKSLVRILKCNPFYKIRNA